MPGHEVDNSATEAEVLDALRPIEALKAEIKKRKDTAAAYVKANGPMVVKGSDGNVIGYIDNRQTVKEIPDQDLLLESLIGIGAEDVLEFLVKFKLTPAQLAWFIHKSPWKDIIRAEMRIEEGEGILMHYGSASIDMRASPAGVGHHVVQAGEKPMSNKYDAEDEE